MREMIIMKEVPTVRGTSFINTFIFLSHFQYLQHSSKGNLRYFSGYHRSTGFNSLAYNNNANNNNKTQGGQ